MRLVKISLAINRTIHYFGCFVLVGLLFLIVGDVGGRILFNNPIRGAHELTGLSVAVIAFLSMGYAQHHEDHVSIDILFNQFSPKVRHYIFVFSSLIYLVVIVLMAWWMFIYSQTLMSGGYTTSILTLPLYPIVWIAVIGLVAFMLAVLSESIIYKKEGK